MGTRNLTMVIDQEGTLKVARYGQWDGYPSGVGLSILSFLKNKKLFEKFKSKLSKLRFLEGNGKDKDFLESYNEDAINPKYIDNGTEEQKRWFDTYCNRDLADKVLVNIANSEDREIVLTDSINTGNPDGCVDVRYSYRINLKDNTFGIYEYFDEVPMKVYNLNELPTEDEFVKELKELVDEIEKEWNKLINGEEEEEEE